MKRSFFQITTACVRRFSGTAIFFGRFQNVCVDFLEQPYFLVGSNSLWALQLYCLYRIYVRHHRII